jgi:hypothetical protein
MIINKTKVRIVKGDVKREIETYDLDMEFEKLQYPFLKYTIQFTPEGVDGECEKLPSTSDMKIFLTDLYGHLGSKSNSFIMQCIDADQKYIMAHYQVGDELPSIKDIQEKYREQVRTLQNHIMYKLELLSQDKIRKGREFQPIKWAKSGELLIEFIARMIDNQWIQKGYYDDLTKKVHPMLTWACVTNKFQINNAKKTNLEEMYNSRTQNVGMPGENDDPTLIYLIWMKSERALVDLYYKLIQKKFISEMSETVRGEEINWRGLANTFVIYIDGKIKKMDNEQLPRVLGAIGGKENAESSLSADILHLLSDLDRIKE